MDHYLQPQSGYATTIIVFFFAHLLILEYPDYYQNSISSSLHYPGPLHKILAHFVNNFLSNVHWQTDKQTNATKNITSFAKEVINNTWCNRYVILFNPNNWSHLSKYICE